VGFLALHQGAGEDDEVSDPYDRQPQVGIPFGLRILFALRDAEDVAGAGNDDEEVVANHHEPGGPAAEQTRLAGALNDIEGCRNKRIATERKDHRGGVERAQASKAGPGQIEVEPGEGHLPGDDVADDESGNAPEDGGDGGKLDGPVVVELARCGLISRQLGEHV